MYGEIFRTSTQQKHNSSDMQESVGNLCFRSGQNRVNQPNSHTAEVLTHLRFAVDSDQ